MSNNYLSLTKNQKSFFKYEYYKLIILNINQFTEDPKNMVLIGPRQKNYQKAHQNTAFIRYVAIFFGKIEPNTTNMGTFVG